MNEIVFEKKNKNYGAYKLRKNYPRTIIKAFLWSLLIFLLIFMSPLIITVMNENISYEEVVEVDMTQLLEPPAFEPPLAPVKIKPPDQIQVPKIVKIAPDVKKTLEEKSIVNPNKKLAELFSKNDKDSLLAENDSLAKERESKEDKLSLKVLVDAVPSFPGGQEALYIFLQKNMVYPPLAKKSGIAGTVIVSFKIEANGNHNDAKIIAGIGAGCDDEVLRVIGLMPRWNPGQRRGSNIAFLYNLPVQFALK